jgi:opacity protein-like surface antigen
MGNVATSELDARAQIIANFIKGSASAVQKAKFFDIGVKYRGPAFAGMWRPYIGLGIGVANVDTQVNCVVNGSDVTSQLPAYGIELGNDLTDSLNKTFVVVPLGVQGDFLKRYFVDVSYRFGTIRPRPDDRAGSSDDQRVCGIGIRF